MYLCAVCNFLCGVVWFAVCVWFGVRVFGVYALCVMYCVMLYGVLLCVRGCGVCVACLNVFVSCVCDALCGGAWRWCCFCLCSCCDCV